MEGANRGWQYRPQRGARRSTVSAPPSDFVNGWVGQELTKRFFTYKVLYFTSVLHNLA